MLALRSPSRLPFTGREEEGRPGRWNERHSFLERETFFVSARSPHFPRLPSSLLHFTPLVLSAPHPPRVPCSFSQIYTSFLWPAPSRTPLTPVFFAVSFASLSPFCRRVDSLNSVIHLLFRWRARVFSRFFQFYYSPVVLPLIRVLSSSFFLSQFAEFTAPCG